MTLQSCAIRRQSRKIVKSEKIMAQTFFNYESTCDSTDLPASIYDRKMGARPFDTIYDILRCLSLVKPILKGRTAPIWRKWEPTHMRLSGTALLGNYSFS